MRKVLISEPIILAQSTTEAVMFGGYQDPHIRSKDGVLYVKFNARKDSVETFGLEDANPVLKSFDGGDTWEKGAQDDWKYNCSNTGICALDDNTAVFVYADFTLPDPSGVRAKTIAIRKITVK